MDYPEFILLGCTDLKYRKCSSGENEIQDFEALTCDDCGMQCSEYRSIEEIRPAAVHVDHCQCSNTELCAISTRVNAIVQPGRSKSANTRVDTTLDAGRSPLHNVHFVKYDGPVVKS